MKNSILTLVLLSLMLSACTHEAYIPTSSEVGVNPFGSVISIYTNDKTLIKGELIALDTFSLFVLDKESKHCVQVFVKDIKNFNIKYAKPTEASWTVITSSILSLTHGYFLLATLPINLFVSIMYTSADGYSFKYNNEEISYDTLRMFARFPQGLPANVVLSKINFNK